MLWLYAWSNINPDELVRRNRGIIPRKYGSNNRSNNRRSREQALTRYRPTDRVTLIPVNPGKYMEYVPVRHQDMSRCSTSSIQGMHVYVRSKGMWDTWGLLCRDCSLVLRTLVCNDECEVGSCGYNQKGMGMAIRKIKRVKTGGWLLELFPRYVLLNAAMRVCCIQGHYSVPQSRCDPRLCDVSSVLFLFLYSTL